MGIFPHKNHPASLGDPHDELETHHHPLLTIIIHISTRYYPDINQILTRYEPQINPHGYGNPQVWWIPIATCWTLGEILGIHDIRQAPGGGLRAQQALKCWSLRMGEVDLRVWTHGIDMYCTYMYIVQIYIYIHTIIYTDVQYIWLYLWDIHSFSQYDFLLFLCSVQFPQPDTSSREASLGPKRRRTRVRFTAARGVDLCMSLGQINRLIGPCMAGCKE